MTPFTIVEFVLARIAEDEAVARTAGDGDDEWEYADHCAAMQIQTVALHGTLGYEEHIAITHDYEGLSDSVNKDAGPHIARWDPARVLALCEVNRLIVEQCDLMLRVDRDHPADPTAQSAGLASAGVLGYLANLYADHPDFQEAWRI